MIVFFDFSVYGKKQLDKTNFKTRNWFSSFNNAAFNGGVFQHPFRCGI